LIVLRRDLAQIQTTPTPSELHLVVEVADSSLGQDLNTKAALYARAGIAEYWVADVQSSRLIVHRQPEPHAGVYRDVQVYLQGESIAPLASTEHPVAISEVFA
jgi:Uma2 family endonuclease